MQLHGTVITNLVKIKCTKAIIKRVRKRKFEE